MKSKLSFSLIPLIQFILTNRKCSTNTRSKGPNKSDHSKRNSVCPEPLEGGSATVEKAPEGDYKSDLVQFVSQELTKSDRPELTSAKNIVAGGKLYFD